jgi:tRNA (mo5U34)-methyltransferase
LRAVAVSELSTDALREEVAALEWYHTLELAPGVVTPGWFDTRTVVSSLPIPASLEGKRCLDVGTFDGFWAFEMERRGADEVVGVDVLNPADFDWPPNTTEEVVEAMARRKGAGHGFEVAKRCFGSSVTRHELSVYDVDPDALGTFDFVYLGSLLLHLRDPVRALERLRAVCTGQLLIVDSIDLLLTLLFPRRPTASLDVRARPWWWTANVAGIARMVEAANFRVAAKPGRIFMPPGTGQPLPPLRPRLMLSEHGREAVLKRLKGDPHVVLTAAPA